MGDLVQRTSVNVLRELKESLISATIRNAKRSDFYRDYLAGIEPDDVTWESLSKVPCVNKSQLFQAGRSAQVRDKVVCDEIFTSGTTGPPFISVRSDREQTFIRAFYNEFFNGPEYAVRSRGLQINNPYHGGFVAVPSPIHMHRIGIYDRGSFDHARFVLASSHSDHGVSSHCTILVGLERALRAFAHDTLALHPGGLPNKLSAIVSYAQYLTERGRCLIESAFGAPVRDRYGLSEIFGGASQDASGWYFFDPSVLAQVVTPVSHSPVLEGTGLLVLTALFPFQEAQPFIRYITGDIVSVTHSVSTRFGEIAIRPLGRQRYGIPAADGEGWLLVPADVYEEIDVVPQIRRTPLFRDSAQIADPEVIGHPRYHVSFSDEGYCRHVVIHVELGDNYLMDASMICSMLRERVLTRSASMSAAVRAGIALLDVEAVKVFASDVISYRE